MNTKTLIDTVIRQTTVLVAQLATTAGIRAPLAHVAKQVFLDLSQEIEAQGVSRKVAADMFGLALRSYQLKVQRLSESVSDRDTSLWQAILEYIRAEQVVGRADVLLRFAADDEASVKGILHDLVESGLVFQTGSGRSRTYRAASDEDLEQVLARERAESAPWLVWIAVYRHGPLSRAELGATLGLEEEAIDEALDTLVTEGRISREQEGEAIYRADTCVIPMEEPAGWEAAVFDHFNAMVTALALKLRELRLQTLPADIVGGSTYSFDIGAGHPYEDEVLALLRDTRERVSALRQKVTRYNQENGRADEGGRKVTFYFGQSVIESPTDTEGDI